ncbi:MAG TPA: hypothetical protein VET30_11160, partial [Pseudoxanthomonas sp.]|nr:hypothetical protein [Pseudoxanthomonas sp.]
MQAALLPRLIVMLALATMAPLATAAGNAKRPITAQDLWAVKRVGAPALSPDGKRAVVSVQEWSIEKNKPTASLWLVDVSDGKARRLTNAGSSDGSATWSHDGSRIAFVATRGSDTTAALYVIAADGGEAERLLELPYGVSNPRWLPGDAAIVLGTKVIPEMAGAFDKASL